MGRWRRSAPSTTCRKPWSIRGFRFRVRVVRSITNARASSVMPTGPLFDTTPSSENWVARRPLGFKASS